MVPVFVILKAVVGFGVRAAIKKYGKKAVQNAIKNTNKKFKVTTKISKPQKYEDGRKLMKDQRLNQVTVNARNLKEAKELAKQKVKKSSGYKADAEALVFENAPRGQRIDIYRVLKKKGNTDRLVFESPKAKRLRKILND
jgi:Ni,Fe-hydrogenase III large subunit